MNPANSNSTATDTPVPHLRDGCFVAKVGLPDFLAAFVLRIGSRGQRTPPCLKSERKLSGCPISNGPIV